MNHAYCLVWSASHGAYLVAPETARRGGRAVLAACCLAAAGLAHAQVPAATVVPASAPGSATRATVSANGIPVVNINAANGAGLSYNQYQRYDVDSRGLVLNNSMARRQSVLAGQVDANAALGAEARLILNEVVAPQRSVLAGFTEVLGGRADVIVANPYGITCSGCGFINADRVTLSTGTPVFGANGSLNALHVRTGDVLVQGQGMNASDQQLLDIVTRSLRLDGPLNARDLHVTTGLAQWDYAGRTVSGGATGVGPAPAYAIDSSRLGGIYADRIRLVATEAGVGVRMRGEAAARADDFTLDAAGRIQLHGRLSAARNVALAQTGDAAGIEIADPGTLDDAGQASRASVTAGAALHASTPGELMLSGAELKAGADLVLRARDLTDRSVSQASRAANGRVDAIFSGAASIQGARWGAGSRFGLAAGTFLSDGALFYSGADANAAESELRIATGAGMALDATRLVSGTDVRLAAGGQLAVGAGTDIEARRDMALTARGTLRNAGELLASRALSVRAAAPDATLAVENSGRMQGNALAIGAAGERLALGNSGSLVGASVDIAGDSLDNAGRIQASERLAVSVSGGMLNRAGASLANTAAGSQVALSGATVDNQGAVQSAGALDVIAGGALVNRGTMLTLRGIDGGADGAMLLRAGSIDNSGWIDASGASRVMADGAIDNSGRIRGDTLVLGAAALRNRDAGSILRGANGVLMLGGAGFTFDNRGLLASGKDLVLQAPAGSSLHNHDEGMIASDGHMNLNGGTLRNSGVMQSGAAMTLGLAAEAVNEAGGTIHARGGPLKLSAARLDNDGKVQADAGLDAVVGGQLRNSGAMLNQDGARSLALTATAIENAGTLQSAGAALLNVDNILLNRGLIQAAADIDLFSRGYLVNEKAGRILGENLVRIAGPDMQLAVTNLGTIRADGLLALGADGAMLDLLHNTPGAMLQAGRLAINARELTNSARIQSDGAADLRAGSLDNDNGAAVILAGLDGSASSMSIDAALQNRGAIHSGGRMRIQAGSVMNGDTGGMSSLANLSLHLNAHGLDNSGTLYAAGLLTLSAPDQAIVNRSSGTMDGGDVVIRAGVFDNYNAVSATRDIDIAVTNAFRNLPAGGVPAVIEKVTSSPVSATSRVEDIDLFTRYVTTLYEEKESVAQELVSPLPEVRGRIIAGRTLSIDYGAQGENRASLLSAPTVNLYSSKPDGAGFVNADLHLDAYDRERRWTKVELQSLFHPDTVTYWYPESAARFSCNGGTCFTSQAASAEAARAASYVNEVGRKTIKTYDAGIYAGKLNVQGASLLNLGSPFSPTVQARSASRLPVPDDNTWLAGDAAMAIVADSNSGSQVGALPFDVANLRLPTNPNGYFVPSRDPQARYLVETNPLFVSPPAATVNFQPQSPSQAPAVVGSDYLVKLLQLDPDKVQRRLGDAAYENQIVRQQLIAQVGRNLLQTGVGEAAQMQSLMESSVDQLEALGLVFGRALSDEQAAAVESDMVWMVEVEIKGRKVLMPVVYLSQATRKGYASGPVIAAGSIDANVASLTNHGGAIKADGKLAVRSAGDVRNLSGSMKAGDAVIAAGGDFINETVAVVKGGGDLFAHTDMGRTATVDSGADLLISAENVNFKGAKAAAKKDLAIEARRTVQIDTQDEHQARSGVGSVKGHASVLSAGGNLDASAGTDMLIAGSRLDSGKDMVLDAGEHLDVIARTDTESSSKQSGKSGFGVGGGLYGIQTTTEKKTEQQNRQSALAAGGKGSLLAGKDLVVSGSDISAKDKLLLTGDQVTLQSGKTAATSEKVTETTSFLATSTSSKVEKAASASAQASASDKLQKQAYKDVDGVSTVDGSKGDTTSNRAIAMAETSVSTSRSVDKKGKVDETSKRSGKAASQSLTGTQTREKPVTADNKPATQVATKAASAKAGAKAEASATGKGELNLMRSQVDTEREEEASLARSSLSGREVEIKAADALDIQSAAVRAERDIRMSGRSVRITSAAETSASSKTSKVTDVGLLAESNNTASASASANASAEAKATTMGSDRGKGLDAKAALEASAEAAVKAKSDNIVDLVRTEQTTENSAAGKSLETSIAAGGNLQITAVDSLSTEGGTLSGREGVDLKARKMAFGVAADSREAGSTESKTSFGLALKAEASADASAKASVKAETSMSAATRQGNDTGAYGLADRDAGRASVSASATASASANADAGAQGGLQFKHGTAGKSTGSTQAKATRIVSAEGNVSRIASGRITDVGTSIEAGGDVVQQSDAFESRAGSNTASRHDESSAHAGRLVSYAKAGAGASADASASASAGLGYLGGNALDKEQDSKTDTRAGASVGAQIEYSYKSARKDAGSATAVVSSIRAGGNIAISTSDAMRMEGTQIKSGGKLDLSGRRIDILAAGNSASSSSADTSASGTLSAGTGVGSNYAVEGALKGQLKNSTDNATRSSARVAGLDAGGDLTIRSQGDLLMVGTKLTAGGNADVSAAGNIDYRAARDRSQSGTDKVTGSLDLAAGRNDKDNREAILAVSGGYERSNDADNKAVVGAIRAGGDLSIRGGQAVVLEGAALEAKGDASIEAGGALILQAARDNAFSNAQAFKGGINTARVKATDDDGKVMKAKVDAVNASGTVEKQESSQATAVAITAGGSVSTRSRDDTLFEGTAIDARGGIAVAAGGNVTMEAARSTDEALKVSASLAGKKAELPDSSKNVDSRRAESGMRSEKNENFQGSILKSDGAVVVEAGGKAVLVNTEIKSQGQMIRAQSVEQRRKKNRQNVVNTGISGVKRSTGPRPDAAEAAKNKEAVAR
ncbi:hemagglutinin repeat-containing protein [Noviherbaspirillum sp. 1P10PC]|uniref:two-partner secretion domain-containing protein n=1 Tax=Noviherbaspirillum sp. 1P10PC TaxID=3132292 RepID=UPI0039A21A9E